MRTYRFLFILLVAIFVGACGSTQPSGNQENTAVNTGYSEEDPGKMTGSVGVLQDGSSSIDLTNHLRRIGGVYISGEGANARIKVQSGANSISSGTEPLFIVDGSQMGSFRETYEYVTGNEIKSITVLKDPSNTAMYGSRGSNGVILIKLN